MRRQWVGGALAAAPGVAALALAAAFAPPESELWIGMGALGVLVAVHPRLRWTQTLVVVAVVVPAAVRAGIVGLPLPVAAGLGLLLFSYILGLDLLSSIGEGPEPAGPLLRGWFEALSLPIAAGLGGTAVAIAAATLPLRPSLPLALAGLLALIVMGALGLRGASPRRSPSTCPGSVELRDR